MKKIFLYLTIAFATLTSCRKDDDNTIEEVSIETQNAYDDEAAQKFLKDHYFNRRGMVVAFDSSISSDDNETPLSDLNPVKLPSGVIYIIRNNPSSGTNVAARDNISWMVNATTYVSVKEKDGIAKFLNALPFRNTITGSGIPESDPSYYYVRTSVLNKYNSDNGTSKTRSFYEIEGLQEALRNFRSFEIPDSENYNLQGVIIVPSRAAFARDEHYPYVAFPLTNKSFVFNFQIYRTRPRTSAQD